jgi:hypothetical protein
VNHGLEGDQLKSKPEAARSGMQLVPHRFEAPMTSPPPPLERPLSRSRAIALLEARALPPAAGHELVAVCEARAPWRAPDAAGWRRFFETHLLAIGVVFVAVAAVFFFAANWSALSGWTRLGIVSTSIAASSAVAVRLGLDRLAGKAALTLSGLLIGPVLAVYGQIYQTGADSYELFVGWALLLLPFTLLVRWSALVLFHLALVELAWVLFTTQVWGVHFFEAPLAWGTLALFNIMAFFATELARQQGFGHRTLPRVFLVAALLLIGPRAGRELHALADGAGVQLWIVGSLLCVALSVVVVSVRRRRDVFGLAATGVTLVLSALPAVLELLKDSFGGSWRARTFAEVIAGAFVMVGIFVVGTVVRRAYAHQALHDDGADEGVLS